MTDRMPENVAVAMERYTVASTALQRAYATARQAGPCREVFRERATLLRDMDSLYTRDADNPWIRDMLVDGEPDDAAAIKCIKDSLSASYEIDPMDADPYPEGAVTHTLSVSDGMFRREITLELYPDESEILIDGRDGKVGVRGAYYSWRILVDGYPALEFDCDEQSALIGLPGWVRRRMRDLMCTGGKLESDRLTSGGAGGAVWSLTKTRPDHKGHDVVRWRVGVAESHGGLAVEWDATDGDLEALAEFVDGFNTGMAEMAY